MDEDTDETETDRLTAELRRVLIWEANSSYDGFTAEMVTDLIDYTITDLGLGVMEHPAFPAGVIRAYAAHNGIDLRHYARTRPPREGN